uniref:Lambda-crystallin n=2 Tax=Ascaris TaxID=6251 RepID=F1L3G5_ASCSU
MDEKMARGKVSIVGCGLIGSYWGTLFASAGYNVCLYDISAEKIEAAKKSIEKKLRLLEIDDLLRGPGTASEQFKNVSSTLDLAECLAGSIYCQESTTESEQSKKEIFSKMDELASDDLILASSTSTIPASHFTERLKRRSQCLVSHPINPPLFIPLVEIVPSPWTSEDVVMRTCAVMRTIGQSPVRLQREIVGFALNRIQFAIIAEAWRLVKEGVLSPEDVDIVMKDGLGPRYAFYGPLGVMHMNANGIEDYMNRFAGGMVNVLRDLGPTPTFEESEARTMVTEALNAEMPVSRMAEFVADRERRLAELCKLKKRFDAEAQNGL